MGYRIEVRSLWARVGWGAGWDRNKRRYIRNFRLGGFGCGFRWVRGWGLGSGREGSGDRDRDGIGRG
eukprot:1330129-Amorphochlora_amoeboformis.AAC.1